MRITLIAIIGSFVLCACVGDYGFQARGATDEEKAQLESEKKPKKRRVASEDDPFLSPPPDGMVDVDVIVTHWAKDLGELEFSLKVLDSTSDGLIQVLDKEKMPYDPMAALVVGTMRTRKIRVAKGRVIFDARVYGELGSDLAISIEAHRYIHISISDDSISFSVDTERPGFD